jgi:hypothetical protein
MKLWTVDRGLWTVFLVAGLIMVAGQVSGQSKPDMWDTFARTKFDPKYYEKLGEYLFYPTFPAELKALEGKEISIQGYYVPFAPEDGKYIILSKFPMSQCFFCGGGGPESIMEVSFAKGTPKFQVDDLVTVKGKLKLNTEDMEHVNFIMSDAVVVK